MCRFWELSCKAKETAEEIAGSAVEDLADAISSAFARALTELSTFWIDIPTVDISLADGARAFIQNSTTWLTGSLVVLSIMIAGMKIIMERRNEPAMELVKSLLTVVIVSGASVTGIQLMIDISDEFSVWIMDRATVESDLLLLLNPSGVPGAQLPVAFLIVGGIVGIIVSIIQMGLMILRGVMLIILTGILPLAAAMTNTAWGKEWLTKTAGWLTAFLLYKPAAAIIYSTAIILLDSGGGFSGLEGIIRFSMALMTIAMGVLALPSMIKFIMPATAALSSGGGGGGMMGMAAMMGASHMMSGAGGQSAPSGSVPADSAAASSAGGGSASGAAAGGAAAVAGPLIAAGVEGAKAFKGAVEDSTGEGESSSSDAGAPSGSKPPSGADSTSSAEESTGGSGAPQGAGGSDGPTGAGEAPVE